MSIFERLIHRGYFEEVKDDGSELPGGGTDETVDEETEAKGELEEKVEEGTTKVETKEPQIPKVRFDKAVGKARKEAEVASKRAEEAEAKLKSQQGDIDAGQIEGEIDDLYEKADQAQADGQKEVLKALRREIREKQQLLADARAEVKASYKAAQAIEQVRYDRVVEDMEKEHPELNPDNEDGYEEEAVADIMELTEAFVAKGEGSAVALKKAIRLFYKNAKAESDPEDTTTEDRKEAAIKKALDTKAKQPAEKKAGLDSDKGGKKGKITDPSKVSEKDWVTLSKEELAEMRGDSL